MADDNYDIPVAETAPEDQSVGSVGDYAKALGAGALHVGSNLASLSRYFYEQGGGPHGAEISKSLQDVFSTAADETTGSMNEKSKQLLASTLTSDEFLSHPLIGTALKATGMVPAVAALALPGGLLADAVGATAIVAGGGAALNAGGVVDEFYKKVDDASDDELKAQSPYYASLREGFDEKTARARYAQKMLGMAPAINAIIGAAVGAVGPAGTVARGLAGGAEGAVAGAAGRGALASGAIGATEGAAGNALQAGVADVTGQQVAIDAGLQKEFDAAQAANATLEGGALGGLMGGVAGAVLHGGKTPKPSTVEKINKTLDSVDKNPAVTSAATNEAVPQPKTGATGTPAKPVETPEVGNVQNAPTRGSRDGAKAKPAGKGKAEAEVVAPAAPDAAQTAAITANEAPPNATPTEAAAVETQATQSPVAGALERLQQDPNQQAAPAPVTPQGSAPPDVAAASRRLAQPVDTGVNVPEQPATLAEQQAQLAAGRRKAVMYPKGTEAPAVPEGMMQTKTIRGVFHYNPKLTSTGEVQRLSKQGRENELLALGSVSKQEAMARAQAGETPVAVTERTPSGTEVKAAAGTDQTAARQTAELEATKTPGNTVGVETPENVLVKRTGRILPRLDKVPEPTVNLNEVAKANLKAAPKFDEEGDRVRTGKNYKTEEREEIDRHIKGADEITGKHAPAKNEEGYLTTPAARDNVIARARQMVADAEAAGVKIPGQLKKSAKGNALSDAPSIQTLRYAKDLVTKADKYKAGKKITDAVALFKEREEGVRSGHADEELAKRRAEGDEAMRRDQGDVDTRAGNEVSLDEAREESKSGAQDVEKNAVQTKTPQSAKGTVRLDEGTEQREIVRKDGKTEVVHAAQAAGDARRVDASDAEKRAIIERMNKLMSRPPREAPVTDALEAAARQVDRNPTEAQKVAGNYKKGHVKVDGLDITLENPRGSIRRGVGPDGKPWEVRMPEHYGYIKRTNGADGDHIDAYVGRSGTRHFVVDQLDERTGAFDEHKVMLNFKDEAEAMAAYKRAFSDGRGEERLGNIHEVTMDELKTWLKEGDHEESHTSHVYNAPEEGTLAGDYLRAPNGERVKAIRSDYLSNELERMDFSKLEGVGGTLAKFFKSRLLKLAEDSDTAVHFVTPEEMAKLLPPKPGQEIAYGYHTIDQNGTSQIVLRNDIQDNGIEHGSLAHVMLHEAIHSVTVREINSNPAARKAINTLMRRAADWMEHPDNAPFIELNYGNETRYGFTNEKEFIAEAFSNKAFQEVLSQIPMNDPVMAEYLGLNRNNMSMWDVFRGYVKKAVEKITGALPNFDSVLDGIMKIGEHVTAVHREQFVEPRKYAAGKGAVHDVVEGEAFRMMDEARDGVKRMLEDRELNSPDNAPKLLKLRTFDNIAQIADHYFGENNPVRKIHEAIEAMRVKGEALFHKSAPVVRDLVALRAQHPEQFKEFSNLLHDATVANVHPDVALTDAKNAHLGKDTLKGVWPKKQHAELSARFNALPEEFKAAWHEATSYFTKQQNAMTLGIINNQILKLMGIKDEALGQRIHEGTLTDADRETLGTMLPVIERASELSKIEGPYVPLIRRGDFVVKGKYRLSTPANAKRISENEFEFKTRKEAIAFAEGNELQSNIRSVWVDENTGELHTVTPEGKEIKVLKQDLQAENRFRVNVQNEHVEFHPTRRAAEQRARELAKSGDLEVHKVVPRQIEPNARAASEMSTALGNLVKKLEASQSYKDATPLQQASLRRAIEEAALSSHGSTRIQSKSLPRRGVRGYSEDLVQNTADYAFSSARYLARLEHAPELEAGIKQMNEQIKQDYSKDGQFGRQAIANDVLARVNGDNGFEQGGKFSAVVKRALSISFIDKLASPAYSVINAMQPGMVTMPYLTGKHGAGRSFVALGKAYSDISAIKIVRQAGAETFRRLKGSGKPDDFISEIKARLSSDEERRMLDEHVRVGTVDPSAGMEIKELTRDTSGLGGKIDAGLGYLEGVTREMPRAIEAINRTATALAAFRLERARGASYEDALQYSKDAVNNTQFNYSPTNAPKVFNHPVMKMALQFKKYGQGIYQLLGMQIGKAMRNAEPGDRAQALKTLAGLAATHTAMAGALGLPTEPFKYLVMGANAVGLTSLGWGDVENKFREKAASVFGRTGGEVVSRGLPRLLNVDLSRVGLDSVTSFGEPRSNKEADVKKWLFDSLAGPVASLGGDWVKGINQIANGDYERAAENLIPMKAASDSLRAYRQATEGKKSAGGRDVMSAYSPSETALRVLGFGNAREAEIGAKRSAFYSSSNAQKDERSGLVNAWTQAKPSEKYKAMAAITAWNKTVPAEVRIKPKELTDKLKRDAASATKQKFGISTNKRDAHFLAEGEIYNTR